MIDTIIFDNEGVIADTESAWDKEQEVFLGRRGIIYRREETKHLLGGKSIKEGAKILKKIYNLSGDDDTLTNERYSIVKDLFNREIKLVSGFLEFYKEIRQKFKTCVATSLDEDLLRIIDKKLSISKLFDGHVYSLKHVNFKSKPDPDIFLYAAQELKSEPVNCAVIEDSPYGLLAARAAGMKSIALTTTYVKDKLKDADVIIDYFSDINPDTLHLI